MSQNINLIYSTFPSIETAESAAREMVAARLVACANILPGMISVYEWNGALERGEEVVVVLKTTTTRTAEVIARLTALHPFEVPAIVVLPVSGGLPAYLEWVSRAVTDTTAL